MSERGKLIVVEAAMNRIGKTSLTNALVESLVSSGIDVKQYHFHDRDALTGKYIENLHTGNLPFSINDLSPLFVANLYLLDMAAHMEQINKDLEDGAYVILDRYYYSTMIYQTTMSRVNVSKELPSRVLKETVRLAEKVYKLPKPDITFFLNARDIIHSYHSSVNDKEDGFEAFSFQKELLETVKCILHWEDYFQDFIILDKGVDGATVETEELMDVIKNHYLPELK